MAGRRTADAVPAALSCTCTLIARDGTTGQMGIATASKFLAVGSVVPFLRPGVGAVAVQYRHEPRMAYEILEELESGVAPSDAADRAMKFFGEPENRQVAVLMANPQKGQQAYFAHTGESCPEWAGHHADENLVLVGNHLAGEAVLAAARKGFEACPSPHLAERLVEGLLAADRAGGDTRGKQAAAVKVVGNEAFQAPAVDLRVDDHHDATAELHRLWILFRRQTGTQTALPPPPPRSLPAENPAAETAE